MKKLLLVLAIGAFAACNNGETTKTEDSTTITVDTNTVVPEMDTTGTVTPDTLSAGTDSAR